MILKIQSEIDYSGMDVIVYFLCNDKKYRYRTFVNKDVVNIEVENIEDIISILIDNKIVLYKNDLLEV